MTAVCILLYHVSDSHRDDHVVGFHQNVRIHAAWFLLEPTFRRNTSLPSSESSVLQLLVNAIVFSYNVDSFHPADGGD
jgi:hypothetical protein